MDESDYTHEKKEECEEGTPITKNNINSCIADERRALRKRLNLRENLSPQQLQMCGEFLIGQGTDFENKTIGRWAREEHEKFIEGKNMISINIIIALGLFGKEWKKVEQHIGTRSGA